MYPENIYARRTETLVLVRDAGARSNTKHRNVTEPETQTGQNTERWY